MATVVQVKNSGQFTAALDVMTFDAPVTTGNAVIVALANINVDMTLIVSDLINGTYTPIVELTGTASYNGFIHAKRGVTGGFTDVTIDPSVSTIMNITIYEVSGLDDVTAPLTGSAAEGALTSHTCSSTPLTGAGFICAAMGTGSTVTITPPAGWTVDTVPGVYTHEMHHTGTFASETGVFTIGGTPLAARSVLALFVNTIPPSDLSVAVAEPVIGSSVF